jgi:cellulose synthase/poly-beta-1,6-N-acetylglucosamine synthase-like glycosyltransferase
MPEFWTIISVLTWLAVGLLLVPVAVVVIEVAMACMPRRKREWRIGSRPDVAVLIPAYDESAVIERTLQSVGPQLRPGDRLIVVADNCSDDTAAIARKCGAEVVERFDKVNRGKGFALDRGVRHLVERPPAILVLLDADVTLRPGTIETLARQARLTGRPAQGVYVLREPPSADGRDVVSHLAFVLRNQVRPAGLARLGGPCPLFGAGMAFPWQLIADAPLASGNIVEDMALGLDLSMRGKSPQFCAEAFIDGSLPKASAAADKQRRRWEHGHLRTIFTQVPRVLFNGITHFRRQTTMLAFDLFVPPLSLLVFLLLLGLVACIALAVFTPLTFLPAATVFFGTAFLLLALVVAWTRFNEHDRSIGVLLSAPGYMVRKLPMYFSFFARRGERDWKRTDRDPS